MRGLSDPCFWCLGAGGGWAHLPNPGSPLLPAMESILVISPSHAARFQIDFGGGVAGGVGGALCSPCSCFPGLCAFSMPVEKAILSFLPSHYGPCSCRPGALLGWWLPFQSHQVLGRGKWGWLCGPLLVVPGRFGAVVPRVHKEVKPTRWLSRAGVEKVAEFLAGEGVVLEHPVPSEPQAGGLHTWQPLHYPLPPMSLRFTARGPAGKWINKMLCNEVKKGDFWGGAGACCPLGTTSRGHSCPP